MLEGHQILGSKKFFKFVNNQFGYYRTANLTLNATNLLQLFANTDILTISTIINSPKVIVVEYPVFSVSRLTGDINSNIYSDNGWNLEVKEEKIDLKAFANLIEQASQKEKFYLYQAYAKEGDFFVKYATVNLDNFDVSIKQYKSRNYSESRESHVVGTFKGGNGSEGFEYNKKYKATLTSFKDGSILLVTTEGLQCEYQSIHALLNNWLITHDNLHS